MSKNINDASLANLKHYEGKWKHGQTRTIRVPITFADATLQYARQLDKGIEPPDTSNLSDEVKQLKGEIERLQNELGNLRVQNETLKQRLDSSQLQESWVQRDLALGVKKNQQLQSQLETLKASQVVPKSEAPRKVRSVNLTDEAWKFLGDFGEAQGMTLNDYIEALLQRGIPDCSHPFVETGETEVKLYGADIAHQPAAEFDLPEAADLLNRLKAKRKKKATASLADIEAILEILEG
jgi:chromosome segregation ATPase